MHMNMDTSKRRTRYGTDMSKGGIDPFGDKYSPI